MTNEAARKNKALEAAFKAEDLGLWYKDKDNFLTNYDEFVKTADVAKMGDRQLVELYQLAQEMLHTRINSRDLTKGQSDWAPTEEQQDKSITPRFAFLGKMGKELDDRHLKKGLPLPPTMEQRNL